VAEVSAERSKGTAAESLVVDYLHRFNPNVERRALGGAFDRGDIAGIVGCVIEVKAHARLDLAGFVDEAERERLNDNAEVGVAWIKRKGTTNPGAWYVAMTGDQFTHLLRKAGYLP
jgi:hypothetical protein